MTLLPHACACMHRRKPTGSLCLQAALMTEHCTLVSLQRTAKQIVEQNAEKLLEVGLGDTQVLSLAEPMKQLYGKPLPQSVDSCLADASARA